MSYSFNAVRETISNKLFNNAFRRGTSAFRLGLVPRGISDHLPIDIRIKQESQHELSIISWNMLADTHLYNNFMNITGTQLLIDAILKKRPEGCLYCDDKRNQMYHFFSELAQFLYSQQLNGRITVDKTLLNNFISLKAQPCRWRILI